METKQNRRTEKRPGKQAAPPKKKKSPPAKPAPEENRKKRPKPQRDEIEVVYTPAKPFNRNRLLLNISVVIAVVVAVFFSLSLFFKVDTITVAGNDRYGAESIVAASGIKNGDSLLGINDAKVSSHIIDSLPYVKKVRVGIKLPGTVNIEIEELDVVYSVQDDTGEWWLMTSDGRLVEMTSESGATERTKIQGVTITGAAPGKSAVAQETPPPSTLPEGMTQPVTISGADRLNVALAVLQHLEQNDILGQMVWVDVSNLGNIQMMYGQQYRIILGDSSDLKYKIELGVAAIGQLKEHDQGILDISFMDRPEVVYTPASE